MGNSQFSGRGSVSVALERGQYHAGESVKGYIQVQSNGEMQCTDLIAHFHGEVRTVVHYTRTYEERYEENGEWKTKTITTHHTAFQREYIVEESRYVARFANGVAPPGMYQFPFQFNLHPSLPSSVYVEGHDNASIMYGVEVRLVRPGIFKPDLVHRTMFDLIAHVPHPITPDYTIDRQDVNCCCCFGKGSVTMSAALEQNAFRANEPVNVRVQFENQSSSEVQRIDVEVHEDVYFTAMGEGERKVRTIASATLPESIPAGGGFGENLGTDHKLVNIRLPPFNHCTLRSRLLTITHCVRVRAITPFGITNPSIDLPVTLHRSGLAQAAFSPPLHEGEELGFGEIMAYHPDSNAMQSPFALDFAPSAPVAPWHDGEAPQQQQMAQPQMAQQAMGQPQMAQPAIGQPQMAQFAMGQPQMAQPAMGQPQMAQPAFGQQQMAQMAQPAMGQPQMAQAMPVAQAAPAYAMQTDMRQPLIGGAPAMPPSGGAPAM